MSTPETSAVSASSCCPSFNKHQHIAYLRRCLVRGLPAAYDSADVNRLTLVHFCVQGLDLLNALEEVLPSRTDKDEIESNNGLTREGVADWIYKLQTLPTTAKSTVAKPGSTSNNTHEDQANHATAVASRLGGFKGGTYLGPAYCNTASCSCSSPAFFPGRVYNHSHMAMTYTALCTLMALQDDFSRLDQAAVMASLHRCRRSDGCFQSTTTKSTIIEEEYDMRFLYCAVAISSVLNNFSAFSTDGKENFLLQTLKYIASCQCYDGSFGLLPGREGHGGSTFCAVASLYLLGELYNYETKFGGNNWRRKCLYWCVARQTTPPVSSAHVDGAGMQGRANKPEDTCYSYWIGATSQLLQQSLREEPEAPAPQHTRILLDAKALTTFVLSCQWTAGGPNNWGGIAKARCMPPDVLHTFYSLSWLSLFVEDYFREDKKTVGDQGEEHKVNVFGLKDANFNALDCALGMRRSKARYFRRNARRTKDNTLCSNTRTEKEDISSNRTV